MIFRLLLLFMYMYHIHAASLRVFKSKDNYVEIPLTSPRGLPNTLNLTFSTVIFAFGFNNSPSSNTSVTITNAYTKLKENTDLNYILLNWEKEATSKIAGPIIQYPTTGINNAQKIGKQLADVLLELSKHGLNLDNVHLVGHSLGAQLVSYTGKELKKNGKSVGRITGIDAAGPLFSKPKFVQGLEKDDAEFVVAVHTDPQYYGTSENVGHIDIWPNCEHKVQPGCPNKFLDGCSHGRGVLYYAESINFPKAFPAIQAVNCDDWKTNNNSNNTNKIIHMGENIDKKSRGYFSLRTNAVSPFGKGLDGIHA